MNQIGSLQNIIPYLRSPAISYDSKQIAFCYAGNIWIVPADGGEARMITSHSGYDDLPRFSPDGSRLAFMSKRTGNGDIYTSFSVRAANLGRGRFSHADKPSQYRESSLC